jgi:hypothetical protein
MKTAAELPATTGLDPEVTPTPRQLSVVHRKVSVKGSGGVAATIVVTVQQGQVWMSIQPPFTWGAIMEPRNVDELIRTLALAAEGAKKIAGRRLPERSCGESPAVHALWE